MGRIGGNFIVAYTSTSIRMDDKQNLIALINDQIFGKNILEEVATDKGYYSHKNVQALQTLEICADGIQRPKSVKLELSDRRRFLASR